MRVRLSRTAENDLSAIQEFYLDHAPDVADRVRLAIVAAIDLVGARPEIGPRSQHTPGLRSKLVVRYPFRIHYRVVDDIIEVVTIRHTAMREWPGER
jgi:plasmid stabilization system protein ParE